MTDLAHKSTFHENINLCFHTPNLVFNRHEIPFFCGSNLRVTSLISYFQKSHYFVLALTHTVLPQISGSWIYKKHAFMYFCFDYKGEILFLDISIQCFYLWFRGHGFAKNVFCLYFYVFFASIIRGKSCFYIFPLSVESLTAVSFCMSTPLK